MNTGIGDAANLGWKLAQAVRHPRGAEGLLESYAQERSAIARRVLSSTDRMFSLLNAPSLAGRIWRAVALPVILPLAFRLPVLRRRAFLTISQTGHAYPCGPMADGRHGAIAGGMRLPWIPSVDNHAEVARTAGWQIHVFAPASPELAFLASAARLPLHTLPWSHDAAAAGFRRDGLYLVRPDGHLALAAAQHRLDALEQWLPFTEAAREPFAA